jgi:hypothetical protein
MNIRVIDRFAADLHHGRSAIQPCPVSGLLGNAATVGHQSPAAPRPVSGNPERTTPDGESGAVLEAGEFGRDGEVERILAHILSPARTITPAGEHTDPLTAVSDGRRDRPHPSRLVTLDGNGAFAAPFSSMRG